MKIKITNTTIAKLLSVSKRAKQEWAWDTALPGFGALVGKGVTYYVRRRVNGEREQINIGTHGEPRVSDGKAWDADLARADAMRLLADLAQHKPIVRDADINGAPTLRYALKMHLEAMEADDCSKRSIDTLKRDVERYFAAEIDGPIQAFTKEKLQAIHARIMSNAKENGRKDGANPAGMPAANRAIKSIGFLWNTLDREMDGKLGYNPVLKVPLKKIQASREVVEDVPEWWKRVQTLTPVRRDFYVTCFLTGQRSEALRALRWEDLDLDAAEMKPQNLKGFTAGSHDWFKLPIGPYLCNVLRERKLLNAFTFKDLGGDHGWVFPTIVSRDGVATITHIQEAKERRNGVRFVEGPHTARRTWATVAHENDVDELDRSALMNHALGNSTVNALYIRTRFPHLQGIVEIMEAALLKLAEVEVKVPAKTRAARKRA